MKRLAVIGLGVMGGSLARAVRRDAPDAVIVGWDREPRHLVGARDAGAIDVVAEGAAAAVAGADVVVVATPLGALAEVLVGLRDALSTQALVMDVASLQGPALTAAEAAGLSGQYVSAHPLAGNEASGFSASTADLYDGAPVTLSALDDEPGGGAALGAALAFWRSIGAAPLVEDPDAHDRRMALASHLPQLVSNALAATLRDAGVDPDDLGPGGRDMTRLAASDPIMWGDLLHHTGAGVARALRSVAADAERLAGALEAGEVDRVRDVMTQTRTWRRG